ncbi:hypothetical protein D3C77_643580 [compost metagenome]
MQGHSQYITVGGVVGLELDGLVQGLECGFALPLANQGKAIGLMQQCGFRVQRQCLVKLGASLAAAAMAVEPLCQRHARRDEVDIALDGAAQIGLDIGVTAIGLI